MGDYQELKAIRVVALLQGHPFHKRGILAFRPSFIFETAAKTWIASVSVRVGPERRRKPHVNLVIYMLGIAVFSQLHEVLTNFGGADGLHVFNKRALGHCRTRKCHDSGMIHTVIS